ncbi:MAG: Protein-glutamate methylesterase/protein-glutamine glutaminase 2 [Chroococcidiopsis cubana SAG 39.79]|uniref:Protein-glutamate methylesterase/protein-glutamine glutaminase n=1 Tax=Chroococcidiopsis cubana SAG 39.79 TaxID=388085 RepID=A0AB37UD27_9CYAN|nr:chemotaxis-specific protein-glutamate methyltransferase CheB [Chroococcidiopsis cubana]MDZ4872728.1 Protein-glutamate methylesterase/protein-glutamine glutaminase 2 [Chroococcidiopsis cubana SAG 39.79]RUT04896.1 chemotaxis response regulator protein-glutamate methylesterase [Chroococcidiopsis cubana SAG 39.79]
MSKFSVKVLLVEDSPVVLAILKKLLAATSEIEVVGTASNGQEALDKIPELQPNVICTDLHMRKMDGLEFTKQVMAKHPLPILVISSSVQESDTNTIFQLLQAGAIDVFPKPAMGTPSEYDRIKQELITKIKVLSGVSVFTKPLKQPVLSTAALPLVQGRILGSHSGLSSIRMVAVGASTGGPQALQKLFSHLPSHFPAPVICTQHISEGFLPGLVSWLATECQVKVKIAQDGEIPSPGTIYFAPEKCHLEFSSLGKFTLNRATGVVDGHCPSVTVMFKSAAQFYSKGIMGVLLTGMGRDGATGMQAIAQAGGITIAQDEASSIVFGMPKEAIALGAVQHILPIQSIVPFVLSRVFVR